MKRSYKICSLKSVKQEHRHCDKKLARLLFDFRIIPQVLSTQRTTSVNNRFRRSHSVDNICGLTPSWTEGRINIWIYFSTSETTNQNISAGASRANAAPEKVVPTSTVFHSRPKYHIGLYTLLIVFETQPRDGQWTDNGRRTDRHRRPMYIWPLRRASYNQNLTQI